MADTIGSQTSIMHPFYPQSLQINQYSPNNLGVIQILGIFSFALVVLVTPSAIWLLKDYKGSTWRKVAICWFLTSGSIHFILEGHFAWFYKDISSRMDFLSQVWKEYAKGDSRYMSQDSFTVCMETVTAFVEGPLCFLTAYRFSTYHPSRYILQLIVSLGQLYGCVLYFTIEWFEGFIHGPYNHPLYFWFYFFFMNIIWIVIPFLLIVDSYMNLCQAQGHADKKPTTKKH